jgi:hypothetical protein
VPLVEQQHGEEFIGRDVVQANVDTEVQGRAQGEGPPEQQAVFGSLGRVKLIQWAVIATTAFRRLRAETRVAELLAPQCPMDQVAEGGLLGPLPG